jgi:hypothetical protein
VLDNELAVLACIWLQKCAKIPATRETPVEKEAVTYVQSPAFLVYLSADEQEVEARVCKCLSDVGLVDVCEIHVSNKSVTPDDRSIL